MRNDNQGLGSSKGPVRDSTWGHPLWLGRTVLVGIGLAGWFWTQSLIGQRPLPPDSVIGDAILDWTASWHAELVAHPEWANALLIVSSAIIDALGIFLLARSILGPTIRPFLGLLILFGLRQICQGLCALPQPPGIIWRYPGFPSLLVTYGVANDFFFSGHTALAVFGFIEIARMNPRKLFFPALILILFESLVVLVLRAHYTMDVFTGAITALWVAGAASWLAPFVDRYLSRLTGRSAASQTTPAKEG